MELFCLPDSPFLIRFIGHGEQSRLMVFKNQQLTYSLPFPCVETSSASIVLQYASH